MTEQQAEPRANEPAAPYESVSRTTLRRLDRRTFAAVAAGSGVAGVGIARLAFAQTSASTPEASTSTPEAGETDQEDTGDRRDRSTDLLARFDDELASIQADVIAAGSGIDATTITAVLDDAQKQKTAAEAAVTGSDTETAMRTGFAAAGELRVARLLLKAQLSYAGLPSQEERSGRILSAVYDRITAAAEAATADSSVDIAFQVSTAQSLYTQAYDQYGSSVYAQASLNGRAAGDLATIGLVLADKGGPGEFGQGGPRDGFGMRVHRRRNHHGQQDHSTEPEPDVTDATPDASDSGGADSSTPITPPAPDFGS